MPEKKKELLQADLITEVNFDELGMPRVRVHRESHDSIEDANAALMTAVQALAQLPFPGGGRPAAAAKRGPKLSELIGKYIDEQRRANLRPASILDYEGDDTLEKGGRVLPTCL